MNLPRVAFREVTPSAPTLLPHLSCQPAGTSPFFTPTSRATQWRTRVVPRVVPPRALISGVSKRLQSPIVPAPGSEPKLSSAIQEDGFDPRYPPWSPPTKGILSKLPPSWVPYAELSRIEKPGGLYGFYMAYLIGISYGACLVTPAPSPAALAGTAGILLVYNVFLRGAACTINDILDRDYDRQVARCRSRPVARGAVTPSQGYVWYCAQTLGAGVAIACLPNPLTALAYAVPIQYLVSVYPLSKRYTDFPQLVLSVPIAGGALMGAAAVGMDPFQAPTPAMAGATAALFFSHYVWTTIFDYVNACQDTADDMKAGVRSMAVRYRNTSTFIGLLGAMQVGSLVVTGVLAGFSPVYFIGAAGGNALWLAAMVKTAKRSRPDICAWWFSWGGLLVSGTTTLALLAEYIYSSRSDDKQDNLDEAVN